MQESGENYLETILVLEGKKGNVRSIDIATELCYTKPSVSRAVSILKRYDYITVDNSGYILLTEKGRDKANHIYDRHRILTKYLTENLGVDEETAAEDACRIEHVISEKTFDLIKKQVKDGNE